MGDRTYVNLTVPIAHRETVEAIYKDDYSEQNIDKSTATFGFTEVNYGELWNLDQLKALGIAYSSRWEPGGEYGAGEATLRFTKDGNAIEKTVNDSDIGIEVSEFTEARAIADPLQRLKAIEAVIDAKSESVLILSWENQVDYGRRYRTKQLLQPGI